MQNHQHSVVFFNLFDAKIYFNAMATDALAPCVAKSSAAMVLTTRNLCVLVFHVEAFQRHTPSQYEEMIENEKYIFIFFKLIRHNKS